KEQAEEIQNSIKAQREEHWTNYQKNVANFSEKNADFAEVIGGNHPISDAVYEAIVRTEDPAVTYYLGKNLSVLERLNTLDAVTAVVEVGRLSERLKTGTRPKPSAADGGTKPKPKPKLPEPVKPVSSAAQASTLTSAEAAKKRDYRA